MDNREKESIGNYEEQFDANTMDNGTRKKKRRGKIASRILFGLYSLIIFVLMLVYESVKWGLNKWGNLSIEEMIYTLKAPLKGTGQNMVGEYLQKALLPAVLISLGLIIVCALVRRFKKKYITFPFLCLVLAFAVFLGGIKGGYYFWNKLDVGAYMYNQMHPSTFIEKNYVNPAKTKLTFPQKKRNVIYLFLESMEQTYMDSSVGGHHAQNIIPELTTLAKQNVSFSDNDSYVNGAKALTGNTWTIGGMFGATAGLPLKTQVANNENSNSTVFYPKLTTLGDILQKQGYDQTLLIGSDASFGGRDRYFSQHGGYDIEDYLYAKAKGMIPNDYKVFWGYEDEKLFGFAKEKLNNLSKQSKPFNLTMLTVDTHFPTGYWDRNCRSQFPTKYENVMACSSRQVSAFIKWCQTQSWYKDTTIVISGDHPTMNATIQKGTPWDQRLVYTCYINSAVKRDSITRRNFSTQDNFPTTLAAMGVKIQGNRLGLGTNLFSNEKTLLEKYGFNYVDNELKKRSVWMEKQMEASRSNRVDIQQAKGNLPIVKASIEPYTLGQKTATVTINSIKIPKKFKVKSFEVNVSYREDGAYGNTVIVKDPKAGTKVSVDISDEHSQWYIDHYKLKQLYVNVNVSSTSNVKYTVGKGTGKVVWSKEESSQATGKTKTTSIY